MNPRYEPIWLGQSCKILHRGSTEAHLPQSNDALNCDTPSALASKTKLLSLIS